MKAFVFTTLLIGFFFSARAQNASLNGFWTGTLTNDSTTTRKDQSFELALTQYGNKVYGYAHTQFIVNDTLYYIMKRVKGTITDTICEVKDDEILSYNFRGKLDKGVITSYFFTLSQQDTDTSWHLNGKWQTNKTKKYYAVSGKMALQPAKNQQQSKIMSHIQELNLTPSLPFLAITQQEMTAVSKPHHKKTSAAPVDKNKAAVAPKKPAATTKPEASTPQPAVVPGQPSLSTLEKIAVRGIGSSQTVYFTGDSLQLALYDNGEIDGDTVSVQLNGEIVFEKTCLKSTAIKKTIYIPADTDETTLVLYAENLGKYPPNTGLLVVYEGNKRTQVHFSANLQQNAEVVFKRTPKK